MTCKFCGAPNPTEELFIDVLVCKLCFEYEGRDL